MVQTYGVAADRDSASTAVESSAASTINTPLLVSGGQESVEQGGEAAGIRGGHATIPSSVGNLCNTIMGEQNVASPSTSVASSGLLPGILTCLFSGGVGAFGLYLLSVTATRTAHRRASFFAVSQLTFPKAAIFFDAAIAIKCFGVSISYLIIIKGLMPNVVLSLYHDLLPGDPPAWATSGRLWITLLMAALIPLSFARRLDSLRHASYIAVFAAGYLVIIVVVCYFYPIKGTTPPGPVYWIHFTPNFVSTFPVQVFAYTCGQNIFPIHNELISNSQKRMNVIIATSIGTAALAYEIIAVFGYLTFGTNVGSNIVAMYPSTSLFIAFGQLAIVVTVLLGHPLQVHPCRNCLDKVFRTEPAVSKPVVVVHDNDANEDEPEELDEVHGSTEMTPTKHAVLTAAIIAFGFLIAYFVDDLTLVLSFVGSTGSTTISFILPGLFFWSLFRDDPDTSKALTWGALALAGYGMLIFVFCLSYNIYQVVQGPRLL
ncbi:transmembrane amino acid transporter protein-domain-containing protein [Hysterangium stoloniferum]|nr:transmembrane amino acid transporter protein-domain-containing protein [Hysterangium stoloniferum]